MMKFTKVRVWTWERFFLGTKTICTELDVTEQQVKSWIDQSTERGGGGNYKAESLTSKVLKIKESRLDLTKLTNISHMTHH